MLSMSFPVLLISVLMSSGKHGSSLFWLPDSILVRFPFINFHKDSTFRVYYNCLLKWSVRTRRVGTGEQPVWWPHLCFWFLCLWFQVHNMEIIILVHSTSLRTKRRSHCQEWVMLSNITVMAEKTRQIRKLRQMPPFNICVCPLTLHKTRAALPWSRGGT